MLYNFIIILGIKTVVETIRKGGRVLNAVSSVSKAASTSSHHDPFHTNSAELYCRRGAAN